MKVDSVDRTEPAEGLDQAGGFTAASRRYHRRLTGKAPVTRGVLSVL